MKRRVYLLAIERQDGVMMSAHPTAEARTAYLYEYVSEHWDAGEADANMGPIPDERGLAIDSYFDSQWENWFVESYLQRTEDIDFPE